jgi:hypothetical protein
MRFPHSKRFAFTIIDDTDVATVENVAPIYRLLEELGLRTTKTVWPVGCPEGSANYSSSQTLEDPDYLAFVTDLQQRGFEITWHGATMESSTRERTIRALERFQELFSQYPKLHANHSANQENIYWGADRLDIGLLKLAIRRFATGGMPPFEGHLPGSPFFWGDLCRQNVQYVRNLTFNSLNLAEINPSMPYFDAKRPLVRQWFSASDAEDAEQFVDLPSPEQQERLESRGGFTIVATHFGKGFVLEGRIHPQVRERLEMLAKRPGWFPTVSELLGYLDSQPKPSRLPIREWRKMQWRWAWDLALRKWKARWRRRSSRERFHGGTKSR